MRSRSRPRPKAGCDPARHLLVRPGSVRAHTGNPTLLPAAHLPGPYRWEAFSIDAHAVLTHRCPVGTYRGPGITEATFVRERMLDLVADALELDPAEFAAGTSWRRRRCRSCTTWGPMRPRSSTRVAIFQRSSSVCSTRAPTRSCEPAAAGRWAAGETVGLGIAAGVELGAIGPFEEGARLRGSPTGSFVVRSGNRLAGAGRGDRRRPDRGG